MGKQETTQTQKSPQETQAQQTKNQKYDKKYKNKIIKEKKNPTVKTIQIGFMPLSGSWGSCVCSHVIIGHLSCVLSPVLIVPCTQYQQGKLLPDKCVIDFQSLLIVISSPNPMTSKIQWWQRDCSLLLACDERQSGKRPWLKSLFQLITEIRQDIIISGILHTLLGKVLLLLVIKSLYLWLCPTSGRDWGCCSVGRVLT